MKESRWVRCPICQSKTRIKVYENSVLLHFPMYCPKCKQEIQINVVQFKMTVSKEPDA
ncbi:MAG: cysteine-rich KTR domain-containing protein [Ruthenibacterium sp.]